MARTLENSNVVPRKVHEDVAYDRGQERAEVLTSVMLDPRTADDLRDKGRRLARHGFGR